MAIYSDEDDLYRWRPSDSMPVQDDRFPIGGWNPGLNAVPPLRVLRLIGYWRDLVTQIGPDTAGAAFEQCANQLEAMMLESREVTR